MLSRTRHRTAKVALALSALLVLGAVTQVAVAAGGKKGSTTTLSLVVLEDGTTTRSTAEAVPHWGGQITFEVATSATDKPYVNVRCYQNSAFVYDGWGGFYAGNWSGQIYTLSSTYWTGGEADCDAALVMLGKNGRTRTLATTSFHVAA